MMLQLGGRSTIPKAFNGFWDELIPLRINEH